MRHSGSRTWFVGYTISALLWLVASLVVVGVFLNVVDLSKPTKTFCSSEEDMEAHLCIIAVGQVRGRRVGARWASTAHTHALLLLSPHSTPMASFRSASLASASSTFPRCVRGDVPWHAPNHRGAWA